MDWKDWRLQNALALDQWLNAFLGGMADETLSSRSFRMWKAGRKIGWMMRWIERSFFWQTIRQEAIGHYHNAYLNEIERLHVLLEMRK